MPLIDFNEVVERRGVPLSDTRFLRHDGDEGTGEWHRGRAAFGHFASYQSSQSSPYNQCRYAFHFIPDRQLDGNHTALFVGATEVRDEWTYDCRRHAPMSTDEAVNASLHRPQRGVYAYDLVWMPKFNDLVERVVVAWGANPRAWSQWADKQRKDVVEYRRHAQERPFPGYPNLVISINQVRQLPDSWSTALRVVKGVYLLVHPDGRQYVGSAYGEDGFLGRWSEYAQTGHGGNKLLREHGPANYAASILEVTSSQLDMAGIIGRENQWKAKLGSRAYGLNAN